MQISASSKIIKGDFPPSSSVTRFSWVAASVKIFLPVETEPVNEIFAIRGWFTNIAPTVPLP